MRSVIRRARRVAGALKREFFPSPEVAAWRRACRLAETTPRFQPGSLRMLAYELRYLDLLSLCPQWDDIFVRRSLAFEATSRSPRVLDCGANVGLATLFYKRQYPAARVTAFEADPEIASLLARNLRDNGAGDVEVVPAAIWTNSGQIAFRAEGADSGAIDGVVADAGGRVITVPSRRLADILAQEPIDLLKLDIEGAEAEVLEDCAAALSSVRALIVEIHEFDPANRRAPRVLDVLTRAGFAYSVASITPVRSRSTGPASGSPFPGGALCWVMAVDAWREDRP